MVMPVVIVIGITLSFTLKCVGVGFNTAVIFWLILGAIDAVNSSVSNVGEIIYIILIAPVVMGIVFEISLRIKSRKSNVCTSNELKIYNSASAKGNQHEFNDN